MQPIQSPEKLDEIPVFQTKVDPLRLELLHQLWKIKQGLERLSGQPVHLTQLRKDAGYLQTMLKEAEDAADPEMQQAVARIRDLLAQGVVLDQEFHLDDAPSLLIKPEVNPIPASGARSRWPMAMLATVLAISALIGIFMAGWPLLPLAGDAPPTAGKPVVPAQVVLRIQGSNTLGAELLPTIAEAFLKKEGATTVRRVEIAPNEWRIEGAIDRAMDPVAIEIKAHGSGTAFKALADGSADIGAASRPAKPEEAQLLKHFGDITSPVVEHVVGLDGIAVIVNKTNPVRTLTKELIARIFSGEITDWAEVGGASGRIHRYARDEKSGTFDTFQHLVMGKAKLDDQTVRLESSEELSDRVAKDAAGIGFIGLPYVRNAQAIAVSDGATTLPMLPTPFTVATEDYALARRLYLYAPPNLQHPYLRAFVEFALTDEGQRLVNQTGFVSQTVVATRPPMQRSLPDEYMELVANAERLSLSVRFRTESNLLDNKAQRDLERVVGFLARHPGRRIILLGFTDAQGDPAKNLELSRQRAQEVERELMTRGIFPNMVKGFGSAVPLANNDNPQNATRNRRVEIWII